MSTINTKLLQAFQRSFPQSVNYGKHNIELILRRFVAWACDWVLASIVPNLLWNLLREHHALSGFPRYTHQLWNELFFCLYYVGFYYSRWQATLGMRLVRLKIISVGGGKPALKQCLMTYAVFSVFQYWYNRYGYLSNVLGLPQANTIHPSNALTHALLAGAVVGKFLSFLATYIPLIFSSGRQSLANRMGNTEIIATDRSAAAS